MDILENYVIGCGIRGKKQYSNPFEKKYRKLSNEDFEKCEEVRIKLMEALSDFAKRDFEDMTVAEISDAICQFIAVVGHNTSQAHSQSAQSIIVN
jgi:ATP-dependent helicase/DNAse subunit B